MGGRYRVKLMEVQAGGAVFYGQRETRVKLGPSGFRFLGECAQVVDLSHRSMVTKACGRGIR